MELRNTFEVPASPERVWAFLLDIEGVIPCMPGAELTEVVDERNWKGKVSVKLGPVKMAFAGSVFMEERDDAARKVVLKGKGTETGGKGMVSAVVTSQVFPAGAGTRVEILTDLKISGAAAQYGRGLIGDVSEHFTAQFAQAMAARLNQPPPAAPMEPEPPPVESGTQAGAEAPGTAEPGGSGMAALDMPAAAGPGAPAAAGPVAPGAAVRAGAPAASAGPVVPAPRTAPPLPPVKPISGFQLLLWLLSRRLGRLWRRILGRSTDGQKGPG